MLGVLGSSGAQLFCVPFRVAKDVLCRNSQLSANLIELRDGHRQVTFFQLNVGRLLELMFPRLLRRRR